MAQKEPVGEEYTGPSGIARDSTWLTNEDLSEGKDTAVVIERVLRYKTLEFEGKKPRRDALALKFAGVGRVLLVNATARKQLNKAFGNLVAGWKGQSIKLFVTECEAFGDTVKCIRLRNPAARTATAAEAFLMDEKKEGPDTSELHHSNVPVLEAAQALGLTQSELDRVPGATPADVLAELNRMADQK